ncbi:uncharacterized protein RSE6_03892 [Rhynchosporium secalis]|uniref:Uncharacterized protein n=1 Tax=Rhynchosporium secalis TaxID=38038 RepID=A0A1E1M3Y6_RHYSE|nr:uncharacterized protein RSE6_03892 [Rhynchosporium secalis]
MDASSQEFHGWLNADFSNRLSRRLSPSNQVDIRSVIAFHERVIRTAGVIGIETPGQQDIGSVRRRYGRSDSDSGTDSHSSSSYSTSDSNKDSSDHKRKKSKKSPGKLAPPTRKRKPVEHVLKPTHSFGQGSTPFQRIPIDPPPIVLQNAGAGPMLIMLLKPTTPGPVILNLVLPPAYSEAQRLPSSMQLPNAGPTNGKLTIPEKAEKTDTNRGNTEVKVVNTPPIIEPRLFKSKSNSFSFKLKSLFRSKQSLGEEMKKALEDSEFILRTHTGLANSHERNIVVLKVIEDNKPNAWSTLLRDVLAKRPAPYIINDRLILAILREKLVDGKHFPPLGFGSRIMPPPSPPQAGFPAMPPRKPGLGHPPPPHRTWIIRPPPGLQSYHRFITISDLRQHHRFQAPHERASKQTTRSPHGRAESLLSETRDSSGVGAQISLHNDVGEMQFLSQVHSAKATTIHLIAKRRFKVSYNPIQVYRELMNERPRLPSQGYASTRDKTTAAAATRARTADATPASDACHLRPQTLL